jgi:hypothetical protein
MGTWLQSEALRSKALALEHKLISLFVSQANNVQRLCKSKVKVKLWVHQFIFSLDE